MGSGKSTNGKKLSRILKLPFADLDLYIQNKEHKTVQFIFENEGEEEFRKLETKYLNELIQLPESHVISLGGGTVCFNKNINLIKKSGLLIYLEMTAADLAERLLKSKQKRPLLKNYNSETLITFVEEKLAERNVFYCQAQIIVKGSNITHLQLHNAILEYKTKNSIV